MSMIHNCFWQSLELDWNYTVSAIDIFLTCVINTQQQLVCIFFHSGLRGSRIKLVASEFASASSFFLQSASASTKIWTASTSLLSFHLRTIFRRADKLAIELQKYQRDYLSALSCCVYRPLVDPDDGAYFELPERDRHIATVKSLARNMKSNHDRILGCSIPTIGKPNLVFSEAQCSFLGARIDKFENFSVKLSLEIYIGLKQSNLFQKVTYFCWK